MKIFLYAVSITAYIAGAFVPAYAQWPLGREGLQEAKSSDGLPNVTGSGRFQIFVSPQAKGYTFMLDTDTGKVWIMKKDHTSGEFSMQRIPVEQVDSKDGAKSESDGKKASEKDAAGKK
ncbi:MAG TPA: hypothetical protein VK463_19230 [Desulfomonilaceae bacterium]|nr:hypothetical protein [Desulfomonilaceae bacterium]